MQKIDKTDSMPDKTEKELKEYKVESWGSIPETVKAPLREQLLAEQKSLCCYCCQSIEGKPTHIEHLNCRQHYPKLSFDYANLLLSCNTPKQCGNAKGNQDLPLHPLMDECDTEIKLNLAGELMATTNRGVTSIGILSLNKKAICKRRKSLIDMIKFVFDPAGLQSPPVAIQDRQTLELILQSMQGIPQYQELRYILNKLS